MNSLNLLNKNLLENKRVFVRADLDVPINEKGEVLSFARLDVLRETLDYLVIRGSIVILAGHLGRPEGKIVESLRLDPVSNYIKSLGYKVTKLNNIVGPDVIAAVKNTKAGEVIILENLRFDSREESNNEAFAKELASLADFYINECFAADHRAHASIVGITKFLKSYSGFRLERELESIAKVLENPEKPLVAILGGAKIETKLPVISKFLTLADYILLGGRLGFSYEGDNNNKILVPMDYAGNQEDIGAETIKMYENVIKIAKTIVWNGPVGRIEHVSYMDGTKAIAEAVIDSKAYSLVGGGDTIEALDKLKLRDKISFVSMGGGAMLEHIAGEKLPGLEALGFYEKKGS